jgi:hypothetical protein
MSLTQIGRDILADVDRLALRIVRQVWGVVPGYESPRIRREELEAAVAPNVRAVLEHLIDPTLDDEPSRARARQLGVSRALQGVPLDVIVQSFRVGERLILEAFLLHPDRPSDEELRAGMRLLAEGFDQLSGEVVNAYRQAQEEITAHFDRIARDLIAGLMTGDLTPAEIEDKALLLGSDPAEPCQAIAFSTNSTSEAPGYVGVQRELLAVLAGGRPGRILVGRSRGAELCLVPGQVGPAVVERLEAVLAGSDADLQVAVGAPCEGLAGAGRSCREAIATLEVARARASGEHGAVTLYDQVLVDILVLRSDDASARLIEVFHRPLAGSAHLTETIDSYFEHGMSIRETARALYLHPNSVAYRLSRILELTGFDPRQPYDLMHFWIARRAAVHHAANA